MNKRKRMPTDTVTIYQHETEAQLKMSTKTLRHLRHKINHNKCPVWQNKLKRFATIQAFLLSTVQYDDDEFSAQSQVHDSKATCG
jgi:hypothetical protein